MFTSSLGLTGTYVGLEPFHMDAYVDEQVFRFNNRKNKTDAQRFTKLLSQVAGKRLTYVRLTCDYFRSRIIPKLESKVFPTKYERESRSTVISVPFAAPSLTVM